VQPAHTGVRNGPASGGATTSADPGHLPARDRAAAAERRQRLGSGPAHAGRHGRGRAGAAARRDRRLPGWTHCPSVAWQRSWWVSSCFRLWQRAHHRAARHHLATETTFSTEGEPEADPDGRLARIPSAPHYHPARMTPRPCLGPTSAWGHISRNTSGLLKYQKRTSRFRI
jgi:hypothetical protein